MKNAFKVILLSIVLVFAFYFAKNQYFDSKPASITDEGPITKSIDDNISKIEDVTGGLNASNAMLDINIFGGTEVGKEVRPFNYKEGFESKLKLPLSAKGIIVLFVEFDLEESYTFSGTGHHKGAVKFHVNYETTSYGKIILSKGKRHKKVIEKNDSWSKINKVLVYINGKNEIYIVLGLVPYGGTSSDLELSVGVIKDVENEIASDLEQKRVSLQDVFTLSLETDEIEKPNLDDIDTEDLKFDNNLAIVRSEDTQTLLNWWNKIGKPNQDRIKNKDCEIIVTGYAPNLNPAAERAHAVREKLHKIIRGDDHFDNSEGKKALIISRGREEIAEDPKRYVTIEIK